MFNQQTVKSLITEVFEEEALMLGGLVALHRVDDDLVWSLAQGLDAIREKVLRRVEENPSGWSLGNTARESDLGPHPAIEDLLDRIRQA